MLSFAATLCFFITKVTFLFFSDDPFVSTVHFSKFILFGGFLFYLSLHRSDVDASCRLLPRRVGGFYGVV